MRTLVLGGNRYIGLELVFELARQGHEVTVLNSHEAPLPDGARRLHGDRQQPAFSMRCSHRIATSSTSSSTTPPTTSRTSSR